MPTSGCIHNSAKVRLVLSLMGFVFLWKSKNNLPSVAKRKESFPKSTHVTEVTHEVKYNMTVWSGSLVASM